MGDDSFLKADSHLPTLKLEQSWENGTGVPNQGTGLFTQLSRAALRERKSCYKKTLKFSDPEVTPASCRSQDQGTSAGCPLTGDYLELVGKSKFALEIRGLRKFFISLPLLPTY